MPQQTSPIASKLCAILGPTNTGKTHRAIERMLELPTGMIGLPLRLLAREVYDRITTRLGQDEVALVTGEERRIPKHPRYWVCTVEAMPTTLEVDFVAVDEVQLMAHPERGHVFTERVLHARGIHETWFLGSDAARPLLLRLVPAAKIESFPRLSHLNFVGAHSLGQLPPRSAVVAFSLPRVYELAERLRARKGGAAVVLGALSPRTRNAQVAMYQAGEVDYLVATDAIGMGLNLALEHVAFAGLHKFDGTTQRELLPQELSQIAGRAGRYLTNGTFGTLTPGPSLPDAVARAIEQHRVEPLAMARWRNFDLDLSSLDGALASLSIAPKQPCLRLLDQADDAVALRRLASLPWVRARCREESTVRLLWEVCQIPDYRKLLPEFHAELLAEVFGELLDHHGTLRDAWLEQRLAPLDDTEGDLDTLLGRIAFIRTWTYVSQHHVFGASQRGFDQRTRAIEDRLSDALHERLVLRFVERARTPRRALPAAIRSQPASPAADKSHPFAGLLAWQKGAAGGVRHEESKGWVEVAIDAPHEAFLLDADGRISHAGRELGHLSKGRTLSLPEVTLAKLDLADGHQRRLQRRLLAYARDVVLRLRAGWHDAPSSPATRGLLYQLAENLGSLETSDVEGLLTALSPDEIAALARRGIRLGRRWAWVPALLRREALTQRRALVAAQCGTNGLPRVESASVSLKQKPAGRSFPALALGYVDLGVRWLRCDIADRVVGRPVTTLDAPALLRELGCRKSELWPMLRGLDLQLDGGSHDGLPRIQAKR